MKVKNKETETPGEGDTACAWPTLRTVNQASLMLQTLLAFSWNHTLSYRRSFFSQLMTLHQFYLNFTEITVLYSKDKLRKSLDNEADEITHKVLNHHRSTGLWDQQPTESGGNRCEGDWAVCISGELWIPLAWVVSGEWPSACLAKMFAFL